MHILFIDWNGYGNEDMKEAFREMGHHVKECLFSQGIRTARPEADHILGNELAKGGCDFVFSLNYFPVVSVLCQEFRVPYISWVYDSPYIHVYSYTVLNACNYIFLFDYAVYQELAGAGIPTVHYLPLAVNDKRLARLDNTSSQKSRFGTDISFVGALYDEPKHRLYDRFRNVEPYCRGYLDGIVQAQKKVYGYNFLKELLTPEILEKMQEAYPADPNADTVMAPEAIYADYVLSRQVTSLERREILALLGSRLADRSISLYTNNQSTRISGVDNKGPVDYYGEMPYVFMNSRINLNITLRSIKTGIPLRVFDIMGCGGFVLTNYQEELLHYFEMDADLVCYNDYDDLVGKAEYYLVHEKERMEIAANGCEKVRAEHTMERRIGEMLDVLCKGQI